MNRGVSADVADFGGVGFRVLDHSPDNVECVSLSDFADHSGRGVPYVNGFSHGLPFRLAWLLLYSDRTPSRLVLST